MKRPAVLSLLLVSISVAAPSHAQPFYYPGNNHNYELIPVQTTWAGARAAAEALTFQGFPGHLATITTADENAFIATTFASGQPQYFAWTGGNEPNDNGVWIWSGGPEDGVQFSIGGTATLPFNYVNWGGVEPNDFAAGEDYQAINLGDQFGPIPPGAWIDSPNPNPADPIFGYIVEYETTPTGVGGDAPRSSLWVGQGTPNPFTSSTRIDYAHEGDANVRVDVYDIRGHHVRQLVQAAESSGAHSTTWDGRDGAGHRQPAGIYFSVVRAGPAKEARKLLLID